MNHHWKRSLLAQILVLTITWHWAGADVLQKVQQDQDAVVATADREFAAGNAFFSAVEDFELPGDAKDLEVPDIDDTKLALPLGHDLPRNSFFASPQVSTVWPTKCEIDANQPCAFSFRASVLRQALMSLAKGQRLFVGLFRQQFYRRFSLRGWVTGHPDQLVAMNPIDAHVLDSFSEGGTTADALYEGDFHHGKVLPQGSGYYLALLTGKQREWMPLGNIRILHRSVYFAVWKQGVLTKQSVVSDVRTNVVDDAVHVELALNEILSRKGGASQLLVELVGVTTGKSFIQRQVKLPTGKDSTSARLVIGGENQDEQRLLAQGDELFVRVSVSNGWLQTRSTIYQSAPMDMRRFQRANPFPIHYVFGYNKGQCPTCFCVIESALYHSTLPIYVHAKYVDEFKDEEWYGRLTTKQRRRIHVLPLDFGAIFEETPLAGFHSSQLLQDSKNHIYQLADAARLALVYKYGGIYMDMDMLLLQDGLQRHTYSIGIQARTFRQQIIGIVNGYNNAYFDFPKRDPLVRYLMQRFLKHYHPSIWGFNGPFLFTRMYHACQFRVPPFHLGSKGKEVRRSCRLLTALDQPRAYSIFWADQERVITRDMDDPASKRRMANWYRNWGSYAAKLGGRKIVASGVSRKSTLVSLMQQQCPLALSTAMQPFIHNKQ